MKKERKSFWKGIKVVFTAVVDWVATLFGMKDNSKYGHVLRRVVGTAFAVVVIVWAGMWIYRFGRFLVYYLDIDFGDNNTYYSEQVSDDIAFYDGYYNHFGHLKNSQGKKVLKHIAWISTPLEGDSLVCYSDGEHRGYFHMRDGHLVVKPIYEHAWIFSEGLAAVYADGHIKFIDTKGRAVIDRGFSFVEYDNYVFHKGHCAVSDSTGKYMGLIDRNGDWVIAPQYERIIPTDTFWLVRNGDKQALLTFGMDTVFPPTKACFEVRDTAILATFPNHTQSLYDLQGRLMTANTIRDVEQLMYDTREIVYSEQQQTNPTYDRDLGEYVYSDNNVHFYARKAVANCMRYEAECGWYGLLSPDGRQLTPPSYCSIEAVGQDLYLCETSYGYGVMLNGKGQRVE